MVSRTLCRVDLNNLPDTDTLHCPEGPILEAEKLIADAWGVGQSFILVQGSTSGNVAVALSALRPGEPVLVARNAHKSVLAGLVQVGARPIWLEPRWDDRFGVAHGLDADVVERAFGDSGATALWVLHPTYYGTTGDIAALAELCRRHDAKLLVDGAHSPHFAFHPDLPTPGERAGAAATVQSVHKILSGLSQAAVLHVDPAVLDPAIGAAGAAADPDHQPALRDHGVDRSRPTADDAATAATCSTPPSIGPGAPRPDWPRSRG